MPALLPSLGLCNVDVKAKVHNRGQQLLTIIEVIDARSERTGCPRTRSTKSTLEPGGKREPLYSKLTPAEGDLEASTGDSLVLKLRLTRGRAKRIRLRMTSRA